MQSSIKQRSKAAATCVSVLIGSVATRFALLLVLLACVVLALPPYAHAAENRCDISVGETVSFLDPVEVYSSMQAARLVKDEFETTATFEKRLADAAFSFSAPILLRGTYSRKSANYDADNSRIVMSQGAWGRVGLIWEDVFAPGNKYGIEAAAGPYNHAVGLQSTERAIRTYMGSNAYGASLEVTEVLRTSYGVFDRKYNDHRGVRRQSFFRTWKGETTVGEHKVPGVLIPMPVDEARRSLSNLRVGILVKPRKPFIAEGVSYVEAKISFPKEITWQQHVIIADIICAVISNDDGGVLKTVDVAY